MFSASLPPPSCTVLLSAVKNVIDIMNNNVTTVASSADDIEVEQLRIAVLGAPGVGKTAVIEQLVSHEFTDDYRPTTRCRCYRPSFIINEQVYEVTIVDCPPVTYFPATSLYEWTDFRGYGLRSANAYLLIYDVTDDDSFRFVRSMREQILASRGGHPQDVPMFVMGNKQDLLQQQQQLLLQQQQQQSTQQQAMLLSTSFTAEDRRNLPTRREVANIVKKQWKCGYIECSAKCNWHVVRGFQELMKMVHSIDAGHRPASIHDALLCNRCDIL
ncbi:hypothetical protein NP493_1694g00059 [Ridgeia piscesae]|uniref:Ras-like protein family member 10B n=1 Tax=Ridgeia piscesae TaxID=27915 RepID=A0AAD9N8V3_RIDPI|nr:hypothetical protein NP493_1694g00059 [Ridgeia piscesae]